MLLPFFYHTVSDEDLPHCKHLFPVKTVKQFEADLEFLLKNYEPLHSDELRNRDQFKKPKFLLTFDDGMREVGEIIAPILLKKGVPAIFFVCKDFAEEKAILPNHLLSYLLENQATYLNSDKEILRLSQVLSNKKIEEFEKVKTTFKKQYNSLINSNLYLKTPELKRLSEKGFSIGSHSLNHPYFGQISETEGQRQIAESMDWIVKEFTPKIRTFAFPFEDYFLKKSFFEKLKNVPFSPEFTFGTSDGKSDEIVNSIQRIDAEKDGLPIEQIIKNYKRKKFIRKIFGKDKVNR